MEYRDGQFNHYSPIYVYEFRALKSGKGAFELDFFHANYSTGVQEKTYEFKTVLRNTFILIAERIDSKPNEADPPLTFLSELSSDWLQSHFDFYDASSINKDSQDILNSRFPTIRKRRSQQ